MRLGIEKPFGPGWKVGVAFGYDSLGEMRFDGDRAMAHSEGFHGGVALAKTFGSRDQGSAAISITGGIQTVDLSRRQTVFVTGTGTSRYKTDYVGATADIGYSFGNGPLFVRPGVSASLFRLGQRGFTEAGLAGLGVTGLANHEWIGTVTPKMTVGARIGQAAIISLTGGGVFHNKSDISAPFRLIGANPAADPAIIRTGFDKNAWTGGFDLTIGDVDRISVDLGYRGEFGDRVKSHNAHVSLKARF